MGLRSWNWSCCLAIVWGPDDGVDGATIEVAGDGAEVLVGDVAEHAPEVVDLLKGGGVKLRHGAGAVWCVGFSTAVLRMCR